MPVSGSTFGCRAAHDPFENLDPRAARKCDLAFDEIEFVPSRPARHVDIGAKPQWIDACAYCVFKRRYGREIDDRHRLTGNVGEAKTRSMQHLRGPAQLLGAKGCKEPLDRGPALLGPQVPARGFSAFGRDDERVAFIVEVGAQPGEPPLRISMR